MHPIHAALAAGLLLAGTASEARALSGAELIRNTPQRHGRFEARLRFAAGDGIVSSMFLWKLGSELADAYWNEIDIEKVGADCRGYSSNAIYGNPETQRTERVSTSTDSADLCSTYHTHAIEWTPEHLIWLLDGVERRRLAPSELAAFEENAPAGMQVRFNLWVGDASFGGVFSPSSLPARQYLEWVAYSSFTPGAGPEGSDFTPLWREEFDAALGPEWSLGSWPSPLGHSTHVPANVTVSQGVAVLSLTEDGATGYAGAPPVEGGASSAGASVGGGAGTGASGGGAGGMSTSGVAGSGVAGSGITGSGATNGGRPPAQGGCSLDDRVGSYPVWPTLLAALTLGATGRRVRRRSTK